MYVMYVMYVGNVCMYACMHVCINVTYVGMYECM